MELLEVAINSILYTRNIYPDGIFSPRKFYNISVMMSRHPDVNTYIKDVLESIRNFIAAGSVEKIVVQITSKDDVPLERFVFEIHMVTLGENLSEHYFDVESHLRAILLKLNTCEALLKPLPDHHDGDGDCTFQILAYTRASTLERLEEGSSFLNFPWVVADNKQNRITD